MSLDINLTNVESTTNKKTTLTDNSDTFYPTQKAVKTAVDLKVDKVVGKGLSTNDFTNTLKTKLDNIQAGAEVNVNADWDAISGDAQILNKPIIPSISGLVPYTGATADVDLDTFGLDAKFIKIKGTAGNGHLNLKHQSSGATAGGSESVIYADASGNPKWKNDGNAVQDVLLSGTTTADIADSTNKRYVTDAQFNVLANTSGTNSGDETQSSILSKLGWFYYNRITESTAVTGTTAETIIENITIPATTFVNGGIIRSYNNKFRKVGNNGTLAIRLYIGPTANNLTGATLVGTFSGIIASQLYAEMLRTFTATTSGILGFSATQSSAVDTGNTSGVRLSASIDWTVEQYFMITVQLGSGSDSVSLIGASLKNF